MTKSHVELKLKSVTHSLLTCLKEKQIDTLVESEESQGNDQADYVILPKGTKDRYTTGAVIGWI